ncbi:PadR family transcriptional regulator [Streptomyces sp. RFCAC02]|uniref:PadR family transcriptional regulator n=1 Tax=Streptomyces sp. RFCAC02 TaxID=2499143 RepID=UPI0010208952|nr:PadR family transcriptional regulator [Streptomyces sp. RFCAC02]
MSVIRLLVLGAIRQHGRAHGYQVRADLDFWGAHEWSGTKPGSIYHALRQMTKEGLLLAHGVEPSTAGGPPRSVYELTAAGEAAYLALLRASLRAHDQRIEVLTAAVGFLVDLPRGEAVALLRERVAALEAWRDEVVRQWTPDGGTHITEIMRLWVHRAESDAAWTRDLIGRLEGGAHVMAGEGPRTSEVLPAEACDDGRR